MKVIEVREKCCKQGSKFYDSLYFGFSLFSGKRKYLGKIRFLQCRVREVSYLLLTDRM